jgi:ribosomal protein L37AE/L43A
MAVQLEKRKETEVDTEVSEVLPTTTVVGWQGVRFQLPPEWNVSAFSMDRDNGSLRVDAPGSSSLTVQIRWMNAAKPQREGPPTAYYFIAPLLRKWFRRPDPPVPKTDLKANIERILKETAKQAKKTKGAFESTIRPEKAEGPDDERTAISFSWTGAGRGQGKIWQCAACNRIVIAQVIGLAKDQAAISAVASQLFATLEDHTTDGYDLWALYDLQIGIPVDFRLEEQQLKSGYLHLTFARGGEKIIVDRWGLANVTRKRFSLVDWFRMQAFAGLKRMKKDEETLYEHEAIHYVGSLNLFDRLRLLKDAKTSLRRFPTRYEGGIWECTDSNKLFAVQVLHSRKTEGLWEEVTDRCVCH